MPMMLIVLLGFFVLLLLYGIAIYNRLVASKNRVEAAWSQIDVQLKRRSNLIPNLVELVKDYMGYEQDTLKAVIDARASAVAAREGGRAGAVAAEGLLGVALGRLFALAEDYPDLKANETLGELQSQLEATETAIAGARQRYNNAVMQLNTMVESFPSNLVAGPFNFAKAVFFEIPEADRKPVRVDLR